MTQPTHGFSPLRYMHTVTFDGVPGATSYNISVDYPQEIKTHTSTMCVQCMRVIGDGGTGHAGDCPVIAACRSENGWGDYGDYIEPEYRVVEDEPSDAILLPAPRDG